MYVSLDFLYLADATCFGCFPITSPTDVTELHKVSLTQNGPTYVASGIVPGHPLNQFIFSERNGFLRIATSAFPGPSNTLFVFGETSGSLHIVGSINDIAPVETIQSARFIGDLGVPVIFRQTRLTQPATLTPDHPMPSSIRKNKRVTHVDPQDCAVHTRRLSPPGSRRVSFVSQIVSQYAQRTIVPE